MEIVFEGKVKTLWRKAFNNNFNNIHLIRKFNYVFINFELLSLVCWWLPGKISLTFLVFVR